MAAVSNHVDCVPFSIIQTKPWSRYRIISEIFKSYCSQNLPESMTDSCPSILMVRTNPPRLKDISRRSVLQSSDVLKITPLGSIVLNLKSFKTFITMLISELYCCWERRGVKIYEYNFPFYHHDKFKMYILFYIWILILGLLS